MEPIYLDPANLPPLVREAWQATFPSYTGKRFELVAAASHECSDMMWSGGSRSEYLLYNFDTKVVDTIPAPQFTDPSFRPVVALTHPWCLVQYAILQGQFKYLRVYVNTVVQRTDVQLSRDQQIVLMYTATYKNSYSGRKDIRFAEAHQRLGITREAWDRAQVSLSINGFLTKQYAITPQGRNAIASLSRHEFKCW